MVKERVPYFWDTDTALKKSHSQKIMHKCWVRKEAVAQTCSVKKVFLEISQNSQEITCARVSFFNKVAGLSPNLKNLRWSEIGKILLNIRKIQAKWGIAKQLWLDPKTAGGAGR